MLEQNAGRKPKETSVNKFCFKRVNLSLEELNNIKIMLFLTFELFRWPNFQKYVTFLTHMTALSTIINAASQKLRNSSIVCHKTKNPFGGKICIDISFQLLLRVIKVNFPKDKKFCSLNFSDDM